MSLEREHARAVNERAALPAPRPAGEFWADFRERARGAAREPRAPIRAAWPRALAMAAGLTVLLGAATLTYRFHSLPVKPTIRAIHIGVPYESVTILSDSRADIVWISGLEAGDPGGG